MTDEMTSGRGEDEDDPRWELPNERKPVPELVSDRVAELVRIGELLPGERLPTEPLLARRFGVARSSVRSGLQRLQARGVVEVNRGRGWYVAEDPHPQVPPIADPDSEREFDDLEVMEVRIALEGIAAALAAARASGVPGKIDEIAKRSREHREAAHDDPDALLRTDKAFHLAVVEAAGNDFLTAVYGSLVPRVDRWRRESFTTPEVHDRSATEHDQIAFQIRRGDEVGARMTMTGHLLGHYRALSRERERDVDPASFPAFVDATDAPDWQQEN